ncbi:MAG: Rid family hydrolase [Pseudomonadota bacterium]
MRAVMPENMREMEASWRMSPAVEVGGLLFLTGFNGADLDGRAPGDAEAQIETAFRQVEATLAEAGAGFEHLIEVTSYHVGLRDHLAAFKSAWAKRMRRPYPAWTAIEVAGFATEGVVIELRCVARAPGSGAA